MGVCFYCGGDTVKSRCIRCYCMQPGLHRKYVDTADAGFTERFAKLGIMATLLYFSLVVFYKIFTLMLKILNT